MLRVSSLGLTRYHDTSRLLPFHLSRSSSEVAVHRMLEAAAGHRVVPHGEDFGRQPDEQPSHDPVAESTIPPSPVLPAIPLGRRRAVIPPLRFRDPGFKSINRFVDGQLISPSVEKADKRVQNPAYNPGFQDASLPNDMSRDNPSFPLGASLSSTPHRLGTHPDPDEFPESEELKNVIATTDSLEDAWRAYQTLLALPSKPDTHPIPYVYLHRLSRFLASTRPRTRTLFLRLVSVLSTLHRTGGTVHVWEWNALIDCAGKGWRKARLEDFKGALDTYHDMVANRDPGARFSGGAFNSTTWEASTENQAPRPDITTYTTLLNIAGRTLNEATLRRASVMLESSGLPPNRITHLTLIRYFGRTNQLSGVRATLFKMQQQGLPIGVDGLNACVWAYARSQRLDIASVVYRVLRHNIEPEDVTGQEDIRVHVERLAATEGLMIPSNMMPDNITFYTLIQAFAYQGDLIQCLRVFMDMISLSDDMRKIIGDYGSQDAPPISSPTLPAFRAIFLGFARHGVSPAYARNLSKAGPLTVRLTASPWTHDNLHSLYESFMDLPHDVKPSERTIYCILKAFSTTSGNDYGKLRRVWEQLVERFGGGWGGRLERFRQAIYESPKK